MAKRIAVVFAIAGVGISVASCSSKPDPVCCTDYNAGSDMSFATFTTRDSTTNLRLRAVAQGAGDLAAVTADSGAELTAACKRIAVELGEAPDEPRNVENNRLGYWCDVATAKLEPLRGTFSLKFQPARCSIDIAAAAACKARCTGGPKCDFKANPPKCTGGALTLACKGVCAAQSTMSCAGVCGGMCEGSCESTSNAMTVACQGTCEGLCSVAPAMDGMCVGTCSGKCTYAGMPPAVDCKGKCTGRCSATGGNPSRCTPPPGSGIVKCDAKCESDFDPLACTGGKLEGGCVIDQACETGCSASASAKADCTPPTFELTILPNAPANLRSALEPTIPTIALIAHGRAKLFLDRIVDLVNLSASIVSDGKLDAMGVSCMGLVGDSLVSTSAQFATMLPIAGSVATSMGLL